MKSPVPLKATFVFDVEHATGTHIVQMLQEAGRLSDILNSFIRFGFNGIKIMVLSDMAFVEGDSAAGWRRGDAGEWTEYGDHDAVWTKLRQKLIAEGKYPGGS